MEQGVIIRRLRIVVGEFVNVRGVGVIYDTF